MVVMLLGVIGDQSLAIPIVQLSAKYFNLNDFRYMKSIFVNGFFLVSILAIGFCFIFYCFDNTINKILFPNTDYLSYIKFVGPIMALFLYGSLYSAILNGCGRNDIVFLNRIIARIFQVVLIYYLFEAGYGVSGLVFGLAFHNLVILMAAIIQASKYISFKGSSVNKAVLLQIGRMALPTFGGRLVGMFTDPMLKIYLSRVIGLESVGTFEISQKANASFSSIPVSALSNIPAQVMKISGGVNEIGDNIHLLRKRAWLYLLAFSLPVLIAAQVLLPSVLQIWLSSYSTDLLLTIRMLLIVYFLHSFSMIDFNIMQGFGKTELHFYSSTIVGMTCFIGILISQLFGPLGYIAVICIYCVAILLGAICNIVYTCYFMNFRGAF